MALINIDTVQRRVFSIAKKMLPDEAIEILTYKRNRGVALIKLDEELFELRERGYHEEIFQVHLDEIPKTLKIILKRECPRSRKVRMYQLKNSDEVGRKRKKL